MPDMILDLDETISQVQQISEGLQVHYPLWTEVQRTQHAAQLLQTTLLKEALACLVSLDNKV